MQIKSKILEIPLKYTLEGLKITDNTAYYEGCGAFRALDIAGDNGKLQPIWKILASIS